MRTIKEQSHRHLAAQWLRWARRKPFHHPGIAPWDTCIIAATHANAHGDLGAYAAIREVAIKFKPVENFYLG